MTTATPELPVSAAEGNALANLLRDFGVPYADVIGATVAFVLTFVVAYMIGRVVVMPIVDRFLEARDLDRHARVPLKKVTWFAIMFVGIAAAFGLAGFSGFLQSLATIAAAATLAIGFAMQDVIRNFVAGVFIFTDRPFRIGDWIEWDEYSGVVEDISLRVTRVRTFDNELLTVPNSDLTEGVIKNPVDGDRLRVKFVFGIGYDSDVEEATEIIVAEANAHPGILEEPAPSVRMTELGDSSVGLQSRIWIGNPSRSDFVKVRSEYVAAVKERFEESGIDIPYPTRTLAGGLAVDVDGAVGAAE